MASGGEKEGGIHCVHVCVINRKLQKGTFEKQTNKELINNNIFNIIIQKLSQ